MRSEQAIQFLELAKQKSFIRASENLYITKQALSYSIKKLEEEFESTFLFKTNTAWSLPTTE